MRGVVAALIMTDPFAPINQKLEEIDNLHHIPHALRNRVAETVALARDFAEKKSSGNIHSFINTYEEILGCLILLYQFSIEHNRIDTRKVLEENIPDRKTIKQMIQSWKADYQRL